MTVTDREFHLLETELERVRVQTDKNADKLDTVDVLVVKVEAMEESFRAARVAFYSLAATILATAVGIVLLAPT